MNMDPYKVLGVYPGCTWGDVKMAYHKLCMKTHPDKMNGDSRLFMMVQQAYTILSQRHNESKKFKAAPKTEQKYDPATLTESNNISPMKLDNFTADKFNSHFDRNKIQQTNPFMNDGYGQYLTSRTKHREDVDVAKSSYINIPKQDIIIYKEPECLQSSTAFANCFEYGKTEVSDFTGGGGTDILQAYCHRADLVDTQQRYQSIDDLQTKRSNDSLQLSTQEQAYLKEQGNLRLKLEAHRLNNVTIDDHNVANKYIMLNRRLG